MPSSDAAVDGDAAKGKESGGSGSTSLASKIGGGFKKVFDFDKATGGEDLGTFGLDESEKKAKKSPKPVSKQVLDVSKTVGETGNGNVSGEDTEDQQELWRNATNFSRYESTLGKAL